MLLLKSLKPRTRSFSATEVSITASSSALSFDQFPLLPRPIEIVSRLDEPCLPHLPRGMVVETIRQRHPIAAQGLFVCTLPDLVEERKKESVEERKHVLVVKVVDAGYGLAGIIIIIVIMVIIIVILSSSVLPLSLSSSSLSWSSSSSSTTSTTTFQFSSSHYFISPFSASSF